MKKRGKWIVGILIVLIAIVSVCYYEVYISYNKITENNYSIENKKISKDVNLVIISDLHDNELGEKNKELIDKIKRLTKIYGRI